MILAADYPFLDIVGTMLVFFLWVMWFWCLMIVLTDVFSRQDASGWTKALWTVFLIFVPVLGMLVYLVAHGKDMADRRLASTQAAQARVDDRIRTVAAGTSSDGGATGEIARAKQLLDSGAIDPAEYQQLKTRALAT
jgi:Phospholipase_D-nuclease N-terminal/Short C-terminal domain